MSSKETEKKILLEAASKYYNDPENMIMSNEEYDKRSKEWEKKYKEKLPVGAPVIEIGTELELSHGYSDFAGTLSKCKNIEELEEWIKKKKIKSKEFYVSMKADGFSITIEFEYNEKTNTQYIAKALTRGQDGIGKDLTALFRNAQSIIPIPESMRSNNYAIGYELVITYQDFESLNKELESKGKKTYKNPRNAISGLISNSGHEYLVKYGTLIPLRIKDIDGTISRYDQISVIEGDLYYEYFFKMKLNEIEEWYKELEQSRFDNETIPFMIDGIVIESADEKERLALGYSNSEPNFATALKFAPAESSTKVTAIKWSVEGNSARFTPVVHFNPVILDGKTYTKVSLANYGRFNDLQLKKDDDILFELRHDTLGYVNKLNTDFNKDNKNPVIKPPKVCPCCKTPLVIFDDVYLECENEICRYNVIGNIYNFVRKMNIKNIGREMIVKIVDNNIWSNITDIINYPSWYNKVKSLEGFGEVSVNNMRKDLEKVLSKEIRIDTLVGSLNIHLIGREKAKLIFTKYTFDEVCEMINNDDYTTLTKIDGVLDKTVESLFEGICKNYDIIMTFVDNLNVNTDVRIKVDKDFKALNICHTGGAEPFDKREYLKEYIESKGHKFVSDVSSSTNILVNNDSTSKSSKNNKAKSLGVTIMTVKELIQYLSPVS